MKQFEHKIVKLAQFQAADPAYGRFGWRVVGVIPDAVILERDRS